ncbi:MAG: DUF1587 domain-containing protein, partial [Bryobacteraceae bacterium]
MPHRSIICALLAAVGVARAQTPSFTQSLFPVLQKANCRNCHNESGVASATRLHVPEPEATPSRIEAFGKGLASLVDRSQPEASLLYNKPTARVPHTGGRLIAPGGAEEAALLAWVRYLASLPPGSTVGAAPAKASPVVMRRLTHAQYNRTVRDLLGDQTSPASQFPPEDFVNGFKNQAETQSVPALLTEAYGAAAERLARNAFRNGDTGSLVPCKPLSARDAECRAQFVREFGLKAFRRPLASKEVTRYAALFGGEADFYKGAQLVIEAMLQSPHFLFRAESSNPGARPYEIATR